LLKVQLPLFFIVILNFLSVLNFILFFCEENFEQDPCDAYGDSNQNKPNLLVGIELFFVHNKEAAT